MIAGIRPSVVELVSGVGSLCEFAIYHTYGSTYK